MRNIKERGKLLHINTMMRADPNTRSMMQLKNLAFLALNQITSARKQKISHSPES